MVKFAKFMSALRERQLRVADRLLSAGYQFCDVDTRKPNIDPPVGMPNAQALGEVNDLLRAQKIAIPEALRAFWEIVGCLEFQGVPPSSWSGCDYPAPVSVIPADPRFIRSEIDQWLETPSDTPVCGGPPNPFFCMVGGDHIHKAGYSGGEYMVIFDGADPRFFGERFDTSFVSYLKECAAWAGFPGLALTPDHTWPLANLLSDLPPLD